MTEIRDVLLATMVADIRDRRGLRQAWDGIDADVKAEILAAWGAMIDAVLTRVAAAERVAAYRAKDAEAVLHPSLLQQQCGDSACMCALHAEHVADAARRAYWSRDPSVTWEECPAAVKELWRSVARAVITANGGPK